MLSRVKKQFARTQLSLTHEEPIVFVICQWQNDKVPKLWYFIYRCMVALYFLGCFLSSTIMFPGKWLIYLTNWGMTLCTVQALIAAIIATGCFFGARQEKQPLTDKSLWFYKFYWVINTVATDLAFEITVLYWSLIFKPGVSDVDPVNVLSHGMNSVIMLLDFCLVSHPVRLLHFIYPVILGVLYTIFTLIYYVAGGLSREGTSYIYPILKWDKPQVTVPIIIGVSVFLFAIHLVTFGLYHLKLKLCRKLKRSSMDYEIDQKSNGNSIEIVEKGAYVNQGADVNDS